MARSYRRTSRMLIVLLAAALALGIFAVVHKPRGAAAAAKPGPAPVALGMPIVAPAGAPAMNPPTGVTPILLASAGSAVPADASSATTRPSGDSIDSQTRGNSIAPAMPAQFASAQNTPSLQPIAQFPTTAPAVQNSAESGSVIDQAKADIAADRLLQARAILNDSLLSGTLSPADAAATKALMSQINDTIVFSPRKFGDDPFGGSVTVAHGETMAHLASENDMTWQLLSRINNVDPRKLRAGATMKVVKGPFHVVVTKSTFTMDVYLGSAGGKGSMYIRSYPVGLGRDDSTPPGTWMVEPHRKIKHPTYYSPRGEGVIAADDPKNPLGPFWIGLTGVEGQAVGKMSYGIHGTIDPNSIGHQSSMGCIRMHNEDVAIVYELLVEGRSTVIVRP